MTDMSKPVPTGFLFDADAMMLEQRSCQPDGRFLVRRSPFDPEQAARLGIAMVAAALARESSLIEPVIEALQSVFRDAGQAHAEAQQAATEAIAKAEH